MPLEVVSSDKLNANWPESLVNKGWRGSKKGGGGRRLLLSPQKPIFCKSQCLIKQIYYDIWLRCFVTAFFYTHSYRYALNLLEAEAVLFPTDTEFQCLQGAGKLLNRGKTVKKVKKANF